MSGKCFIHPLTCLTSQATGTAADAATSAWDLVCKSFATAAAELLKAFGQAFAAMPALNVYSAGISGTYGTCLAISGTVSALVIFGQVIRTAWTHDGSGLAQAATGTGKAVLAWLLTVAVATAALQASDGMTTVIVDRAFGSQQALAGRLATIVNWAEVTGDPGQAVLGGSLLLIFALAGIALVMVLWVELLLRNAAIAVLVAMSPIAAAGLASEATKAWWARTAAATVQLIILKPVIALVFAVGFSMAGTSSGIEQVLDGLLILGLAAFSWPVVARFFTFASIQSSTGSGLAAVLGFLAGAASQNGGGETTGVNPNQWSIAAESRTMAGRAASDGPAPGGAPVEGESGGGGAAVLAGIGFALQRAHQVGAAAAARMEQTAAHGGMSGAYPYSTVSGGQRVGPRNAGRADPAVAPAAPENTPGSAGAAPLAEEPDSWSGRDPSDTLTFDGSPGQLSDTPWHSDEPPTEPIPQITVAERGE
jgi:hypothetical protein